MTHVEPVAEANMRIGLFGGSFNPAHKGHLHVSKTALERLKLDRVWWLLSLQNPLKDAGDYASYEERAQKAREVINSPKIKLSLFEQEQGLIYSIDTIQQLLKRHPRVKFVWLMGADAFAGLDRWKDWQVIVESIPIAVFNRPNSTSRALGSKAAKEYSDFRLNESDANLLVEKKAPAWCFINQPLDYSSSTKIRAQK
jgi:nicotinate-nucleotide adenylyltransferase